MSIATARSFAVQSRSLRVRAACVSFACAVVVVGSVFVGADARACSCTDGRLTLATSSTSGVPRNAALLAIFDLGLPDLDLQLHASADGVDVPLTAPTTLQLGSATVLVVHPADRGWPSQAEITVDSAVGTLIFTTLGLVREVETAPPDDVAVASVIALSSARASNSCSDGTEFHMQLASAAPFLVRSTDDDDVAAPVPTGFGKGLGARTACSGDADWPDATFNARKRFRFAQIAVDGSLTAFSPAVEFAFPDDVDCDGISDDNDGCVDDPGAIADGGSGSVFGGCPDDGDPGDLVCPDGSTPGGGGCASSSSSAASSTTGLAAALLLLLRRRRSS